MVLWCMHVYLSTLCLLSSDWHDYWKLSACCICGLACMHDRYVRGVSVFFSLQSRSGRIYANVCGCVGRKNGLAVVFCFFFFGS